MTRTLDEIAEALEPERTRKQLEAFREQVIDRIHEKFVQRQLEEMNPSLTLEQRKKSLADIATEILGYDDIRQEIDDRLASANGALFGTNRAARRRSQTRRGEKK